MLGETRELCTLRGFTDWQSGEITFANFPPKWVAKNAYSVFPRTTLSETTEVELSEQCVKEASSKKGGIFALRVARGAEACSHGRRACGCHNP